MMKVFLASEVHKTSTHFSYKKHALFCSTFVVHYNYRLATLLGITLFGILQAPQAEIYVLRGENMGHHMARPWRKLKSLNFFFKFYHLLLCFTVN